MIGKTIELAFIAIGIHDVLEIIPENKSTMIRERKEILIFLFKLFILTSQWTVSGLFEVLKPTMRFLDEFE